MPAPAGTWSVERVRLTALSATLVVAALALTGVLRTVFSDARQPLGWAVASGVVAVLLAPIVAVLSRRMPRGAAIALTVIVLVAVALTVVVGFVRDLGGELDRLRTSLPAAAAALEQDATLGELATDLQLETRVQEFVDELDARQANRTTFEGAAGTAPAYFVNVILVVFLLVWGPRTYAAFIRQFAVDEQRERIDAVLTGAASLARRYVLVAAAQAFVVGVVTWAVLWAADVPAPTVLGVVVGAASLVPHAGVVFSSMVPLLLSAALRPGGVTLLLALFFVALQVVSSAVVQRRLHRFSLRVGPAVAVIAALLGYEIYGLGGAMYGFVLAVFALALLETARPPDAEQRPVTA